MDAELRKYLTDLEVRLNAYVDEKISRLETRILDEMRGSLNTLNARTKQGLVQGRYLNERLFEGEYRLLDLERQRAS